MNVYTLYRRHDLHFLVYGAMFVGQTGTALGRGRRLVEATIPEGCSASSRRRWRTGSGRSSRCACTC